MKIAAQTAPAAGTQPAACSRRLFLPTIDARLIAIDADTGKLCESFGDRGIVDLSVGMGEVKAGYYQQTSTRWWRAMWWWWAAASRITTPLANHRAWSARLMSTPANWHGRGIRAIQR